MKKIKDLEAHRSIRIGFEDIGRIAPSSRSAFHHQTSTFRTHHGDTGIDHG